MTWTHSHWCKTNECQCNLILPFPLSFLASSLLTHTSASWLSVSLATKEGTQLPLVLILCYATHSLTHSLTHTHIYIYIYTSSTYTCPQRLDSSGQIIVNALFPCANHSFIWLLIHLFRHRWPISLGCGGSSLSLTRSHTVSFPPPICTWRSNIRLHTLVSSCSHCSSDSRLNFLSDLPFLKLPHVTGPRVNWNQQQSLTLSLTCCILPSSTESILQFPSLNTASQLLLAILLRWREREREREGGKESEIERERGRGREEEAERERHSPSIASSLEAFLATMDYLMLLLALSQKFPFVGLVTWKAIIQCVSV